MGAVTGYSVRGYGEMITDRERMDGYGRALSAAVTPGSVVLDLGAGTGVFAMLACKLGAGHVFAIEPDDAIEIARSTAAANGYSDRITFIKEISTAIDLPTAADVIVSDLRSVLPLHQRHIPAIIDARERMLAPGGRLIPRADTVRVALAEDAQLSAALEEPWLRNELDLDMSAGHESVANSSHKVMLREDQLLVTPRIWAQLDYRTIADPGVARSLNWEVERPGVSHGLAAWFDTELDAESGFSNAPGGPELIYGQGFFPWRRPVELEPGDAVTVDLRADLVGNDYIWSWTLELRPRRGSPRSAVTHHQSTFRASPTPFAMLRRREATHRPLLGTAGQADRFLLAAMDGERTLEEMAHRAAAEFPDHFPVWTAALARAGELAVKYDA